MIRRILNILIALDSLVASILTLGSAHPGETISSMAYRSELHGGYFRFTRPVIDWLFSPFEDKHCQGAYWYAVRKLNLPEDMR